MVHTQRGTPGQLHSLDPFVGDGSGRASIRVLEVWRCEPTSSAIVLGSRQSEDVVDSVACHQAGIEVAKRRSGGGAVLVIPEQMIWIDVVAPGGWLPHDVRESMISVGACWRAALIDVIPDIASELEVHRGGMVESAWSGLVCFAGLGPGEVTRSGQKLVGLSQRRTRDGVRIQGLVHRQSNVQSMRGMFAVEMPVGELPEPACLPDLDVAALAERLAVRLDERVTPNRSA